MLATWLVTRISHPLLEIEAERLLAIDPITLILRERVSSENTSPLLSVRPRSGLASRPLLLRGEDFGLNAGRSPEYDRETVRSCWFPLSGFMQRSRHRSLRTGASASQARLPGHNHTHKPCFRNANVEEDFRGSAWILSLEPELLCPDFRDLAQESQAHQPRPQMPMRRPRFPTIEASLPDSSPAPTGKTQGRTNRIAVARAMARWFIPERPLRTAVVYI